MFLVQSNDIILTKGDSGRIRLKFTNKDGSEYAPNEKDKVVFTVKKKKESFSEIVMTKTGVEIVFGAKETENVPSGEYFYDVYIEKSTMERYTAIEGRLIVRKAVHNFE